MSWDDAIQIFKGVFTFDASLDIPGIGIVLTAFTTNILTWTSPAAVHPAFTYVMSSLALAYLVLKVWIAVLAVKSAHLDNKIKEKQLEE